MTRAGVRRFVLLSIPAVVISSLVFAVVIEGWVRLAWDAKRGTPGFFVADPVRGLRLGEHYDGWFAGVPVRTNVLGFRAARVSHTMRRKQRLQMIFQGMADTGFAPLLDAQ